jgi:hypothetical protein
MDKQMFSEALEVREKCKLHSYVSAATPVQLQYQKDSHTHMYLTLPLASECIIMVDSIDSAERMANDLGIGVVFSREANMFVHPITSFPTDPITHMMACTESGTKLEYKIVKEHGVPSFKHVHNPECTALVGIDVEWRAVLPSGQTEVLTGASLLQISTHTHAYLVDMRLPVHHEATRFIRLLLSLIFSNPYIAKVSWDFSNADLNMVSS